MAHVLDSTRSFLYANPELELPRKRSERFRKLIKQRVRGEPVAYLTGRCEFWSLPIKVNPAVLIPRPETELLVEAALAKIPIKADWRIADLGTGCGAIALAIASERRKCDVHGTDVSGAAIKLARRNADDLGLRRISFQRGAWNKPLQGKFHMLVSNPPYINGDDRHLEQGDLRFEPRKALSPGIDGLTAIQKISQLAGSSLVSGGWLMIEHGFEQGAGSRLSLQNAGYVNVETLHDLQGLERVTVGELP